MEKVLDFFDAAYYINLDKRTDRKEKMEKQLSKLNINAKRFPGIEVTINDIPPSTIKDFQNVADNATREIIKKKIIGLTGNFLSHKAIIKEAKEKNLNNVLIFEDDCTFLDSWETQIHHVINDLKQLEKWDMFFFGGQLVNDTKIITHNIIKHDGVWATHAYAINNSFYDVVLQVDLNYCHAIDVFYLHHDWNSKKYYGPRKIMAVQDDGWSDIWSCPSGGTPWMIQSWEKFVK